MLKSSKKSSASNKYYGNDGLEDILIFRNGIDRPVKLKGNIDLIANNIDFQLLEETHYLPLEEVDSVYIGVIPRDLSAMIVSKYINGTLLDDSKDFYMELLVPGKVKLYKRTKVKLRRANYNRALDIGDKEDSYRFKYEYFIHTENGKLLEVPKKNKSFLKLIASYDGAASFFEKRKLNCENEEDLRLLITYINKKNYDK